MRELFSLFVLSVCLTSSGFSFARYISALPEDTSSRNKSILKVVETRKNQSDWTNQNDIPIILTKGENLVLELDFVKEPILAVRIHSSLGRLVKSYQNVIEKIVMPTEKLEEGIYLIVIKREKNSEIRKFLITTKESKN